MNMDEVDRELVRAQEDARLGSHPAHQEQQPHGEQQLPQRASNEIERVVTASSVSTSSSSEDGMARQRTVGMSRVSTQGDLERHPTELSRIYTARSQHSETIGRSLRSRHSAASKPLPNFGAGKPFPPPLPEREEYVVEFDGEDDPYHAQNWPLNKK